MAPRLQYPSGMAARAQHSSPFTDEIHRLAADHDPACLLDLGGTILFVNEAWERAARENGGGERCAGAGVVGTPLLDHIRGDEPRRMFRMLFQRMLRRAADAHEPPVVATYESNAPDVARLVSTQMRAVTAPGGTLVGVALVHRIVRERPLAEVYPPVDAGDKDWRGPSGAVEQCSCCRRTRRPEAPDEWDFVPGLVAATPVDTVFDYCDLCRALHYPGGN